MKKIIFLLMLSLLPRDSYAMEKKPIFKESTQITEKKYELLRIFVGRDRVKKTKALATVKACCCPSVQWNRVEEYLDSHINYIDMLCNVENYSIIRILQSRSIKFRLMSADDLDIKQDLFCVDYEGTILTEAFQRGIEFDNLCKKECKKAINNVRKMIKSLEFLPIDFKVDDFSQ